MLDCLLLYVPKTNDFYPAHGERIFPMYLPQGLLAVADWVQRQGYRTEVVHMGIEYLCDHSFSLAGYIEKRKPRIVGLCFHWHYQASEVMKTAREIKSGVVRPFVVIGGLSASFFHEELIGWDCADAVIRGDAEAPLALLVEAVCRGNSDFSHVPNLTWKDIGGMRINKQLYCAGKEELARLCFTNFALLKNYRSYIECSGLPWYWIKGLPPGEQLAAPWRINKLFPLPVSRGCQVSCSYCAGSIDSAKAYSGAASLVMIAREKVMESIREAKNNGYNGILVDCPEVEDDQDYFKKLFLMIKEQGLGMGGILIFRAIPSWELLNTAKEAFSGGPYCLVVLSPDSAVEKIRKLNKGCYYSNAQLLALLRQARGVNIKFFLFFTIGLPFETRQDMMETLRFQKELRKEFGNSLEITTELIDLVPGSPLYLFPERYGMVRERTTLRDFCAVHAQAGRETPLGYSRSKNGEAACSEKQMRAMRCNYFCFQRKLPQFRNLPGPLCRFICLLFSLAWKLKSLSSGKRTAFFRSRQK